MEVKQRSFLEAGGDDEFGEVCKSSKKDLFPHTIADIVWLIQIDWIQTKPNKSGIDSIR